MSRPHKRRARASAKFPVGGALSQTPKHLDGLIVFLHDDLLKLDFNSVKWTIRLIALIRTNALFARHKTGVQNWAFLASMNETYKLNGVDRPA